MQILNDSGENIEVYTAEDVAKQIAAKEAEYTPKIADLEKTQSELAEARKALAERAGEFKQFRKLSDDAVAKLSIAEKTNYDNTLLLQEQIERNKSLEKLNYDSKVDSALRAKAGSDDKLFEKMKDTWGIINIDAQTPEQIELKSRMVLGALGVSEPNLVATVAGFSGGYVPPSPEGSGDKSFADSERGKAFGAELGLTLEAKK